MLSETWITIFLTIFILTAAIVQSPLVTTDVSLNTILDLVKTNILHGDMYNILSHNTSWTQNLYAILYILLINVLLLRDLLLCVDILCGVLSIFLVIHDFQVDIYKHIENLADNNSQAFPYSSLKHHRQIVRILRMYNNCYGCLLFTYVIDALMYASLTANDSSSFFVSLTSNVVYLGIFTGMFFLAAFSADGV